MLSSATIKLKTSTSAITPKSNLMDAFHYLTLYDLACPLSFLRGEREREREKKAEEIEKEEKRKKEDDTQLMIKSLGGLN